MTLVLSLIIAVLLVIIGLLIYKYVLPYYEHMENREGVYRSKNGTWTTFIYDTNLTLIDIVNPNSKLEVKLKNNERLFGRHIDDLLSETAEVNKKSARMIVAKVKEVKEKRHSVYFECPLVLEDGSSIFRLCYIENPGNGRIYSHAIEINAKQLIDGRRPFIDKAIIAGTNNIAAGIYTKQYVDDDPRGYRYIFFSQMAKELFENKNITKSPYWDQMDEDIRDRKVMESGVGDEFERCIKDGSGKVTKWLRVAKKKVSSIAGYEYVISTVFDITEIKRQELAYQREKERAEQSDRFKSAFLANMSHEIRTPLNAIVGFSGLLPFVESEEERAEYTNIIHTNNDLLLKLIEDILDLSKIEAGCITINKQEFDISHTMQDLQRMFSAKAKEGVEVLCDLPGTQHIVDLDKNRTIQIMTNFLSNAIKFTTQGYIKIGYRISEQQNEFRRKGLEIYVEDTGKGIAQENLPRVFDRFEKFDPYVQGTGLGMAISKSIVDAYNGKIWVESEIGKGTIFYVQIPDCVM